MNHKSDLFRLRKGRFFLPIIKSSFCGLQTMGGLPLRGNIVTSRSGNILVIARLSCSITAFMILS